MQHLVAGGVAVAVVGHLEIVEVHEHQREGQARASRRRIHLPLQLFLEGAMVAQPGEPIGEGVLPRLVVQLLQLVA